MTKEDLKKKAEQIAFSHYFSNVNRWDWPIRPLDVLWEAALARKKAEDLLTLRDGDSMEVWEIFENWDAVDLYEGVDELTNEIIKGFKEAA